MPLHVSSTVVLIIRRSKLCYTASGVVTPVGGRPVHMLIVDRESSLHSQPCQLSETPNDGHYVLIIRRSKLYYTASGIVTPVGGRPVHRLREDWESSLHSQPCQLSEPSDDEHYVFINRRSKLYYTASGIVTPIGGRPVRSPLSTCAPDGHLQCDDTRCCIVQFDLLMMSTTVLETCRGI